MISTNHHSNLPSSRTKTRLRRPATRMGRQTASSWPSDVLSTLRGSVGSRRVRLWIGDGETLVSTLARGESGYENLLSCPRIRLIVSTKQHTQKGVGEGDSRR